MRRLLRHLKGVPAILRSQSSSNPVNVDTFELDEAIVRRHREIADKWAIFGEKLNTQRSKQQFEELVQTAQEAMKLFQEVGPLDSPLQCEANLLLEAAQASYNLKRLSDAEDFANQAKKSLQRDTKQPDLAKMAEADELIGLIILERGDGAAAEEHFRKILEWIDGDAKRASPMVAVAAQTMRRGILTGIGLSLAKRAAHEEALQLGNGKPFYAKAIDILVDALNSHIEEKDVSSVKATLGCFVESFIGVGDLPQAETTCLKYISWCKQHNDDAGASYGERELERVKALSAKV
jgi:tetratricopeptide (TPR) repeat protein